MALAKENASGFTPYPLPRAEGAGTALAALDFVEHQQHVLLLAQFREALDEVLVGRQDAALALDRLKQHGAGLRADGLLHGFEVVELRELEAGHVGAETLAVLAAAGGGQRGERAAVERILHDHDLVAAGLAAPLARELDEAFIRLGAAVAEENAALAEGLLHDDLGQARHVFVQEEVGHVDERLGLAADRLRDRRMAVAEVANRNARGEVQILAAVRVVEVHATASDEQHSGGAVGVHHVLFVQFLELFRSVLFHGVLKSFL